MKSYPNIFAKVTREPWLITAAKHQAILNLLESRIGAEPSAAIILNSDSDDDFPTPYKEGQQMVIPVHGIIGKHLSSLEMECGGCDLDLVNAAIQEAMDDQKIRSVVFDFRSPGGTVTGVPETAERIAELADEKDEVAAYTDSEMCSAAYWMASQCHVIGCSPSATVGSIGVRLAFLDESRWMENVGVKMNSFQAGKFKTMGAWWRPPTDEEKEMFQASVDRIYAQFKEAVTLKRDVQDEVMQGQCFDGSEAETVGLVDLLTHDLDGFLEALQG